MTDFWLVRHGQTAWNLAGMWQGQATNAPGLDKTGRAQVLGMRNQLMEAGISCIYSSDLLRSRQTAELIAESLKLPVILEPRLREIHLGVWEGMTLNRIEANYPRELAERNRSPLYARAPGGESLLEVSERVCKTANEIAWANMGKSVLIVSHGVSLAIIICQSMGIPLENTYQYIPDNVRPYRVQWNPGRLQT